MNMINPNPLFIVGHKRSGSTHLARILNMHKNIFISNETDILWIVYQFYSELDIYQHEFDGQVGLNNTLKKYRKELISNQSPYETFLNIQLKAMEEGFIAFPSYHDKELQYIGDQKPFQNIDPKVVRFTNQHLPRTSYIHIVRHPKNVIKSCMNFGKQKDGGVMWRGRSTDQILRKWVKVEKWVLKEKSKKKQNLIDLRYEDLLDSPKSEMTKVFSFLNLPSPENVLEEIENSIKRKNEENNIQLEYTQEAMDIMKLYGYDSK